MSIGRNDPCHCGSGEKYKKCCLSGDEARAAESRAASPSYPSMDDVPDVHQARLMLEKMTSLAPHAKTPEMKRLVEQAQMLRSFGERQEEIESARKTLEKHRAEFESLMENESAYLERARAVFSEERFSMAAFSKEQVKGALDKVGYSASRLDDERATNSMLAAILHLADKDARTQLSVILLSSLPDYVAAGRMIEGWIVQHCAYLLLDNPNDSNVFLFEMFSRGYDAMTEDKESRANDFLKEFGLDMDRSWLERWQVFFSLQNRVKRPAGL